MVPNSVKIDLWSCLGALWGPPGAKVLEKGKGLKIKPCRPFCFFLEFMLNMKMNWNWLEKKDLEKPIGENFHILILIHLPEVDLLKTLLNDKLSSRQIFKKIVKNLSLLGKQHLFGRKESPDFSLAAQYRHRVWMPALSIFYIRCSALERRRNTDRCTYCLGTTKRRMKTIFYDFFENLSTIFFDNLSFNRVLGKSTSAIVFFFSGKPIFWIEFLCDSGFQPNPV